MSNASLQSTVEAAWDDRDGINAQTKGEVREIGRLVGPAEWDSDEAKRLIEAVLN